MSKFTEEQGNNLIKLYAYAAEQPDTAWVRNLLRYSDQNECGACFCLAGHAVSAFGEKWEGTSDSGDPALKIVLAKSGIPVTVAESSGNENWLAIYSPSGVSPYDKELGPASEKVTALHRINRHLGMPTGLAKLFAENATAPGHQYAKAITEDVPQETEYE